MNPADVRTLVLRQGLLLAAIGVTAGLTASFWSTRLMAGLLYGVSPLDPVTYGAVVVGITGATLLASYLPARRAASVDPLDALRMD